MDVGIRGFVALVTGGSRGIGFATALALAREGCNVAICGRTESSLSEAALELSATGVEVAAIPGDVLVPADVDDIVKTVVERWGTMHILVNNVGGGGRWGNPCIEETPEDVWVDVHNKNAMAAVRFTRQAIPYMRRQHWGRIVTVASIYGAEGGGRPWFNMTKSAEISLMKTLAMTHYLARDGITFNSVVPGEIMIPGTGAETEKLMDEGAFAHRIEREFPLGRMGTPEEVANVILFVCSPLASLVNGASIRVDGGQSSSF